MKKRVALMLLVALAAPAWAQSMYKWQHPWFKKEITSPTPPTWTYRVIEEKNGVVLVEVTPPGETAPKAVESALAIPSTEPTPARFRYIDPETKKSVTSTSPPTEYQWEKKRIEGDGTVFLKIIDRNSDSPSSPPIAIVAAHRLHADFDTDKYCKEVSRFAGGSYQIEQGCRSGEIKAQQQLSAETIPPEIEKYCAEVAEFGGGSYQIMKGCVTNESRAKSNLK